MTSGDINKAVGLPESIDPDHKYVFRSGEYGIFTYWYKDRAGNYWKYTNAPKEHAEYDKHAGEALMDINQPLPHTNPEFYNEEGLKRHMSVPFGMDTERNPNYDSKDARNTWYELYTSEEGEVRYIYLDTDIKENLDLWVQNQLRVLDANLAAYRKYANVLFEAQHPKDKITAAVLMLADQGLYEPEELADATVGDVEFIDQTIKFLGREFVCDLPFYDFFTSLTAGREPSDPLFELDTVHGRNSIGYNYLYAVFQSMVVSPQYLIYWHSSHMFSRILNRLALQEVSADEIEERVFTELARALTTDEDVRYLVDAKLRNTLLDNYKEAAEEFGKSLSRKVDEGYGVMTVFSDLTTKRGDEIQFSDWLHAEPLHDVSPEEQEAVDAFLQAKQEKDAQEAEGGEEEAPEGAEGEEEGGGEEEPAPAEAP